MGFGSFLKQMNEAVESAGGYEKLADQGMGLAQSFLNPNSSSSSKSSGEDGDELSVPQWGSTEIKGNRKSVLIGINYRGQQGELRGCINDVLLIKQYLTDHQGFSDDSDHMLVLTEDEGDENKPTKERILQAMDWLVSSVQPGDSLFFHYSGHGTRVPDEDGDEEDGFDEALCPLDFKDSGMIIDDVVNRKLVARLPPGCRMTMIMDCCHSGTVCDLPYIFKCTEDNIVNWRTELPSMLINHSWDLKNFKGLLKTGTQFGVKIFQKYRESKASGGDEDEEAKYYRESSKAAMAEVVMFSGCKDHQTSADVADTSKFELPEDCGPGGAGGACTNAFVSAMCGKDNDITYIELLDDMRLQLKEKRFTQVPCLTSSREIPLDAKFTFHDG